MKMSDEDIKKYPDLHIVIKDRIPSIFLNNDKIQTAFMKYANIGMPQFLTYFSPFRYPANPEVSVDPSNMPIVCEQDGDPTIEGGMIVQKRKIRWYGFTLPSDNIQRIYVAEDLARGALSTSLGKVLEATIFHELIHWCRKIDGQPDYDSEEASRGFEKEVYGHVMWRPEGTCGSDKVWMGYALRPLL